MPGGSLPPKTRWHPIALQQLTPNKFAVVVNNILEGQVSVLHTRIPNGHKRVLITDDNETHASLLMELLETDWGVTADWAASAEACLDHIAQNHYDLLILDYRIPKKDGLWVIEELSRRGHRVPVMMMTSFFRPHLSESIRKRLAVEIYDKADGCFEGLARVAGRMLAATATAHAAML
ncbi:MAG: response regulator [candidate division Zixibacteria bacterium]|nr:response regulator [candidate division Zixibacteria bacterium]